jgi:hypothetical protein
MKVALLAACLVLGSCATVINGTHTDVAIRSEPPGASFDLRATAASALRQAARLRAP